MSANACHLNLLMESERVSSSPVRLRIMLPVLAMLACVGLAIWWLVLGGQLMLVNANVERLNAELRERDAAHRSVLELMSRVRELDAELVQLDCYSNSVLRRGEMLASLAEVMPLKVQLVKLELPPPAPPVIPKPPPPPKVAKGTKGKKKGPPPPPPVLGPTGYVERATMVLVGRTPKETPVLSLMESLETDVFTNALVIARDPRDPNQSPKVRSFRQDVTRGKDDKSRLLAFDIEYRLKGRRFDR